MVWDISPFHHHHLPADVQCKATYTVNVYKIDRDRTGYMPDLQPRGNVLG